MDFGLRLSALGLSLNSIIIAKALLGWCHIRLSMANNEGDGVGTVSIGFPQEAARIDSHNGMMICRTFVFNTSKQRDKTFFIIA